MTRKSLMIFLSILLVCLAEKFLIGVFQEIQYPNLPSSISCLSYEPRSDGEPIGPDHLLTEQQIRSDLEIISHYTKCIHTYYMLYGMDKAPKIANEFGLKLIAGIWIDKDLKKNAQEIEVAKQVLQDNKNIFLVTVGNETQLFKTISINKLTVYINQVKKFSTVPVSTEELAIFWPSHPQLAQVVDSIGIHVFTYWDGDDISWSIAKLTSIYSDLSKLYPQKKIYVTETGWPTGGNDRWSAKTSLSNQRRFLVELDLNKNKIGNFYNVVEAFDQPWKIYSTEGRVGAHWGIMDSTGTDKVDEKLAHLSLVGLIVMGLSLLLNLIFSIRYKRLKYEAHIWTHWFFALIITSSAWIILALYEEYLLSSGIIWGILIPSQILLTFIIVSHFLQGIRIYGEDPHLLKLPPQSSNLPFVSVHIPCRNENPDQVIACATSCLKQDYPDFEVIIVDNNTTDPKVWKPLESFSLKHKGKLKFLHVENLPGFKAGALNFALKHTDPKSTVIAVVDSDYIVSAHWLRESVPYLSEKIKVVQSPQSYRRTNDSMFERAIILEQKLFFEIGMRIRNTANAIIEHGTMCIIDKQALAGVGNWAEWCITEDTELGLRMLFAKHQVLYLLKSQGAGIAPKSFFEYQKQRSRWVFGSVRMTIYYFKDFLFRHRLSFKQKYYFLSGWIFWFAHIFYPIFILGSFIGTYVVLKDERLFPPLELSFTLIIFVLLEIFLSFLLVRRITKSKILDVLGVILLGMSLTNTISMAVISGLFQKKKPFMVTSKKSVPETWPEFFHKISYSVILCLGYILLFSLLTSKYGDGNPDIIVWIMMLFILSIVPISVILVEILSFAQSRR